MARFTLPRDLYHGKGALEALKTFEGKKAMICVGGGSMKRFGFLDKAVAYLKEAGMEVQLFEGIEPDPSVETVMKGAAAMEQFQPDWIIAMGGGSPIDAAKAMWIKYEYPDITFEEMCKVFGIPKLRKKAHFCAISSTSGTATEVTAFSIITDYAKGIKYPIADFEITPDVAIVDPELAETVAVLEQKAETMSSLVGQFYDYSRLAADDMPLTLERIDAGRILREALAGNYQLLADAQLHIDADLPEHPLWVLGDTAALSRIFQNLLQNAGRYAESRLSLYAEENNNQLILQFTNDTSRLKGEDVDHLFDRFYTSDASRHQGSTGLGLTVAQALAEDMQGQLTANAHVINDQQFLTFTLTLKKI